MDVKLGQLPSWTLMWDFTPRGVVGAVQRGYCRVTTVRQREERASLELTRCWQLTAFQLLPFLQGTQM